MQQLNILIITGIFPPDIGGPATYVPEVAEYLLKRGHAVTVLTLSDDDKPIDNQKYPYKLVRLRRQQFKLWRIIATVGHIINLGKEADRIFVNGLAFESAIANQWLQKPLVMKIVGDFAWERATTRAWTQDTIDEFQKQNYGPKIKLLKALRNWWSTNADKIIVPSNYLATIIEGWGISREKISVIYNAVEIPTAQENVAIPLQTSIKVITVCRLVRWKHVNEIIKAIVHLEDTGLVIVGDGPERQPLEELVLDLKVADRVYFAGVRSKSEVMTLMKACDVFVLNSTYEGLPHVVIEAMGNGLPVIATAVGGTPEVVEDKGNGRLIPPLNQEALYKTLVELTDSELERDRLARHAPEVMERFSKENMLEECAALLETGAIRLASAQPAIKNLIWP